MRARLVLLLVAAALVASAPEDPFRALDVVKPRVRLAAPEFRLATLDDASVALSDHAGEVVLVHFWATFCAPCRHELPQLRELAARYRDRGFTVLALAADRGNRGGVESLVRELGLDIPVLLDPDGEVRARYEVTGLPFSYLVGRDGRFSGRVIGARDWSDPAARRLVEALLAEEP